MNIKELIPQREPFLFIDQVKDITEQKIIVEMTFNENLDFFKGHFPGNPIVPGVILNEHCFQSAAALIGSKISPDQKAKLAVVSRINSAKFKNMVKPNELITTETTLIEEMGNAAFFKSITKNTEGKKVLIIEFACTVVED